MYNYTHNKHKTNLKNIINNYIYIKGKSMKRRTFLILALVSFAARVFANTSNERNKLNIIKKTLLHMFPTTSKYQGADRFNALRFLIFVIKDPSFEKSDLEFLLEGAQELQSRDKEIINYSKEQTEEALRDFETTKFGQEWLSLVLYYGLEAMLGDPVYHGNKDNCGWENINHVPPLPTASKPFGELL
jgi:gluconate 2-dehydrogenase gamma chain